MSDLGRLGSPYGHRNVDVQIPLEILLGAYSVGAHLFAYESHNPVERLFELGSREPYYRQSRRVEYLPAEHVLGGVLQGVRLHNLHQYLGRTKDEAVFLDGSGYLAIARRDVEALADAVKREATAPRPDHRRLDPSDPRDKQLLDVVNGRVREDGSFSSLLRLADNGMISADTLLRHAVTVNDRYGFQRGPERAQPYQPSRPRVEPVPQPEPQPPPPPAPGGYRNRRVIE